MGGFAMTEADHVRVSAAVHAAEANTSGEIVTIVAEHSDRYLDVALWWSVFAAILALAVLAAFPDFYVGKVQSLLGDWDEWGGSPPARPAPPWEYSRTHR